MKNNLIDNRVMETVAGEIGKQFISKLSLLTKTNRKFTDDFLNSNKTIGKNGVVKIINSATKVTPAEAFVDSITIGTLEEEITTLQFGELYDKSFQITTGERFMSGDERTVNEAVESGVRAIKERAEILILSEIFNKNPDVVVLPSKGDKGVQDYSTLKTVAIQALNGETENGRMKNIVAYGNSQTFQEIASNKDIYQYSENRSKYFDEGLGAGSLKFKQGSQEQVIAQNQLADYELTLNGLDYHRHDFLELPRFVPNIMNGKTEVEAVENVSYKCVFKTDKYEVHLTNEGEDEASFKAQTIITDGVNAHIVLEDFTIDAKDTIDATNLLKVNEYVAKESTGEVVVKSKKDFRNFVLRTDAIAFAMIAPDAPLNSECKVVFNNDLNFGYRVIFGGFDLKTKSTIISIDAYITAQKISDFGVVLFDN